MEFVSPSLLAEGFCDAVSLAKDPNRIPQEAVKTVRAVALGQCSCEGIDPEDNSVWPILAHFACLAFPESARELFITGLRRGAVWQPYYFCDPAKLNHPGFRVLHNVLGIDVGNLLDFSCSNCGRPCTVNSSADAMQLFQQPALDIWLEEWTNRWQEYEKGETLAGRSRVVMFRPLLEGFWNDILASLVNRRSWEWLEERRGYSVATEEAFNRLFEVANAIERVRKKLGPEVPVLRELLGFSVRVFWSAAGFGRPVAWKTCPEEMILDLVGRAFWILRGWINAKLTPITPNAFPESALPYPDKSIFLRLDDVTEISDIAYRLICRLNDKAQEN